MVDIENAEEKVEDIVNTEAIEEPILNSEVQKKKQDKKHRNIGGKIEDIVDKEEDMHTGCTNE